MQPEADECDRDERSLSLGQDLERRHRLIPHQSAISHEDRPPRNARAWILIHSKAVLISG